MWVRRLTALIAILLVTSTAYAFNSNTPSSGIVGGTCTGGQVMGGISAAGVPSCVTPTSAGSYPAGSPPQIGGFSAANVAEAETLGGDATVSRTGANAYGIVVTKTNGVNFTALATAAVPLSIANGGLGGSTAPTVGQIPIATTTSLFSPTAISGDATLASTGALTVTKLNGVAPGPLYSATTPLSIANGGRGSGTAPTAGQIDVAQSTTALGFVTMSGDATITSAGVISVTKIGGITPGGTCGANTWVSSISASGVPTCTAVPGTLPTGTAPQFVGYTAGGAAEAETLGGDATLTRTGANAYSLTVTKTSGVAFGTLATAAVPLSIANGGNGTGTAPTAGQIGIATSGTVYTPTTVGGDGTLSSVGTLVVTKTNGTAFGPLTTTVAPTASGQVLGANTTIPEWETVSGGAGSCGFARTGANAYSMTCSGYAPLASPTFTGTVTTANLTVGSTSTLTGPDGSTHTSAGLTNLSGLGLKTTATATMPDASTFTSAGHNNLVSLGIGQAAGGAAGDPLDISHVVNGPAIIGMWNNSAGASAYNGLQANNGTSQLITGMTGTAYSGGLGPANAGFVFSNAAGGLQLTSNNNGAINIASGGGSVNPPVNVTVNGLSAGQFQAGALSTVLATSSSSGNFNSPMHYSCYHNLGSVAASANSGLFLGANNYGLPMSGILVVRASFSGAATMKSYAITTLGGSGAATSFALAAANYAGGAAPFTLNENINSPSGQNWFYVTNNAASAETIDYTFMQIFGNGTCQ